MRPLVLVPYKKRDGRAKRYAVLQPRLQQHGVFFVSLHVISLLENQGTAFVCRMDTHGCCKVALPRPPSVHLNLDVYRRQLKPLLFKKV